MKKKLHRKKAVRRYTLLQIPELAFVILLLYWAGGWFGLSFAVQITILVIWIIKDIILFFWIWPAYIKNTKTVHDTMIGKVGESIESLDPAGYISIDGELWQAELLPPQKHLAKGERVQVVEGKGLLLQVSPFRE